MGIENFIGKATKKAKGALETLRVAVEDALPAPVEVDAEIYADTKPLIPKKSGARLKAMGSENMVFKKERAGYVYKINFMKSIPLLRAYFNGPGRYADKKEKLKKQIEAYNARYDKLTEYFSEKAVPRQKVFMNKVPISKNLAIELLANVENKNSSQIKILDDEMPSHLHAWISLQEQIELPKNRIGLTAQYPEMRLREFNRRNPFDEKIAKEYQAYYLGFEIFASNDFEWRDENSVKDTALASFGDLKPIHEKAQKDEKLKAFLQEMIRKIIKYTKETGEFMDLAGGDNAFIHQEDGEWKFKLLDVLYAEDFKMEDFKQVANKVRRGEYINRNAFMHALRCLNTMRYVNALAALVEVPDRIMVDELEMTMPEQWLEACGIPKEPPMKIAA